jgi:trehalose 6-phosphate phosphatase
LSSDIDGTLSPIALSPADSFVPEGLRSALKKLHASGQLKLMALVSGRSPLDGRRLVGLSQLLYLGNHGMEALEPYADNPVPAPPVVKFQPLVAAALDLTRQKLLAQSAQAFGFSSEEARKLAWENALLFEDKGLTASIHYRLCPDPDLARQAVLGAAQAACANTGLIISEGRMVVEIRPPVAINKGTALEDLAVRYDLTSLIFIGDDLTDVDAFLALRRLEQAGGKFRQGFAIGVRSPEMNPAIQDNVDWLVDGVGGVEDFLNWLLTQL